MLDLMRNEYDRQEWDFGQLLTVLQNWTGRSPLPSNRKLTIGRHICMN